ncbi:MAG: 2Fe-2S iron-sulfur cluster binding domain-containing protein [Planctomycetes bacterium]|nr:2Fe-2S iron-sulfur cluster binding domain-containing protein [Planctomycetota bacterium]
MADALLSILIISGLAAAWAALLVLVRQYVIRYGQVQITVNDQEPISVEGGSSLLAALTDRKIFIPSACGGRGTCAYCKVKVLEGGGPVSPTETPFLSPQELADGTRLSCQVKLRQPIRIEIPADLLAVREYEARVESIVDLTYDIKRFRFRLVDPERIDFIPGQYVQLLTPTYPGNNEEVYRAYSIASDPGDRTAIDLIIRLVPNGICTTYCFEHLKVGDAARFNGPYGEFRLSETDADIIFIAGGSGMAPIECLLHHMRNTRSTRKAVYFFGGNAVRDMFMAEDMARFERDLPHFRYIPVISRPEEGDGWTGETGLVTEAVDRHVEANSAAEAYLCGSPGMIDAAIKVLQAHGISDDRIFYDKFS